jgi:hypothetical protein
MRSNGSFGNILQTVSVRELVMGCLQLEDLSHMMTASPLLRTYCKNSAAAKKKWQKAVDKLNSMNNADDDANSDTFTRSLNDKVPRFMFDLVAESLSHTILPLTI